MNFIKKNYKKIIVLIIVLLIIFFVIKVINSNDSGKEETEFGYASIGDISRFIESKGIIKSDNGEIKSSVTGKIIKDNVKEGEQVKKGNLLYKIDTSNLQEDINSMYQEIKIIQDEYNELKKEASETNVIFENNAIIESIDVNVGDEIKRGDPLAKILNTDKLILNVDLNEENIDLIKDLYVRKTIKVIVKGQETDGIITSINDYGFDVAFNRVTDEEEGEKAKTSITGEEEYIIKYYDEISVFSNVNGIVSNINYKNNGNILLSTNKNNSNELSTKALELNKKNKELNKLKNSIEDYSIYASQDGVITKKNVKLNDLYDGSGTMCTISGSNDYYTSMQVSENDLKTISEGQKVKIESKLLDKELEGEITNISYNPGDSMDEDYSYYGNEISYYPVTISIDNSFEQDIFNGMHVNIRIILSEKNDILIVPTDAILNGNYVYKVTSEKPLKYEKVKVDIGLSDDENVEIKSGLKENDEVILYGIDIEEEYGAEEAYEEESEEE